RALLMRLGRRLFPEPVSLVYDGRCRTCRRTIATLRAFDVLGRVSYMDGRDPDALRANGLDWLDADALGRGVHAVRGRRRWAGVAAYQAIGPRFPLLWPVLALLIPPIADRLCRHVPRLVPPPGAGRRVPAPGRLSARSRRCRHAPRRGEYCLRRAPDQQRMAIRLLSDLPWDRDARDRLHRGRPAASRR